MIVVISAAVGKAIAITLYAERASNQHGHPVAMLDLTLTG